MKKLELAEQTIIHLKECNTDDQEMDHIYADGLLCEFLIALGYNDLVKEYNKIAKWYA